MTAEIARSTSDPWGSLGVPLKGSLWVPLKGVYRVSFKGVYRVRDQVLRRISRAKKDSKGLEFGIQGFRI